MAMDPGLSAILGALSGGVLAGGTAIITTRLRTIHDTVLAARPEVLRYAKQLRTAAEQNT